MFVDACKLLCNHFISKSNAKKAADLLLKFNKCVEDLYGVEACTMNMHLHRHLYKCLLDFGPIYGFWCFPFERLNCILGSVATNNHDVTTQLMKKFILHQILNSSDIKDNLPDSLYPYIEEITTFTQKILSSFVTGSVAQTLIDQNVLHLRKMYLGQTKQNSYICTMECGCRCVGPIKESYFTASE